LLFDNFLGHSLLRFIHPMFICLFINSLISQSINTHTYLSYY